MTENQLAWKLAHSLSAVDRKGAVCLCYGTTPVCEVYSPDGHWFEVDGRMYATLADALVAYGVE